MKKRYWAEGSVSFFIVGLGQIIKGDSKKGLLLILIFYFVLPISVYISLLLNGYLFLLVLGLVLISGIIIWMYNIWDAWTHEAVI